VGRAQGEGVASSSSTTPTTSWTSPVRTSRMMMSESTAAGRCPQAPVIVV
jgi:hypothetical protein